MRSLKLAAAKFYKQRYNTMSVEMTVHLRTATSQMYSYMEVLDWINSVYAVIKYSCCNPAEKDQIYHNIEKRY